MPIRIYDIAKKLGLDQKEVLSLAKELGISAARVASSSLDKITAEYLEKELRKSLPERPPTANAYNASKPATEPVHGVRLPPASDGPANGFARRAIFRGLTHDDIVFRVLLQREDHRPALTFGSLEKSLPKQLRAVIEPGWRSFIRDDGLEFDSAFQKAVRKHLPGVYYVVMAAEFLGKIPFHLALSHFLQPGQHDWNQALLSEDEVFELAERLTEEVRRHAAALASQTQKSFVRPVIDTKPKHKAKGPTRRCAFCKQSIPASQISEHVDREHINPSRLGDGKVEAKVAPTPHRQTASAPNAVQPHVRRVPATITVAVTAVPSSSLFDRFPRHRCIGCGTIPIPGDYYCYSCAP